jgi:hypothetical protein
MPMTVYAMTKINIRDFAFNHQDILASLTTLSAMNRSSSLVSDMSSFRRQACWLADAAKLNSTRQEEENAKRQNEVSLSKYIRHHYLL